MPYKIVQTLENNRKTLTVVPSEWEADGILFWPRRINEMKLIHVEHSSPKSDWKTIRCQCKREYSSLDEANLEVENMEANSDTENDCDLPLVQSGRLRKSINTRILGEIDFNEHVANLTAASTKQKSQEIVTVRDIGIIPQILPSPLELDRSSASVSANNAKTEASTKQKSQEIVTIKDIGIIPQILPSPLGLELDRSSASVSANNANVDPIIVIPSNPSPSFASVSSHGAASSISNQQQQQEYEIIDSHLLIQIHDEQKQIRQQLAQLQASVDLLLQNVFESATFNADKGKKLNIIKPASNRQELQKLEDMFRDPKNILNTVNNMSFICGASGKARGVDSCYKLIDYFFTRDLLTLCSWTGSSRQGDENKIPLKYFSNVRKCFLTLIIQSEKDFAEVECDKFFKTIIKNAKQRLHPKIMSTTKNRTKKSKVQTNSTNGEEVQENQQDPERQESGQEDN